MNKKILIGIGIILCFGLGVFMYNSPNASFLFASTMNLQEHKAIIKTNRGDIVVQLYPQKTPKTVENFIGLAQKKKYNGSIFHRVIDGFMIQGGDYEYGDGTGGKSIWNKEFEDEFDISLSHKRGAISMANRGPNTNGSQFFIVQGEDISYLDGKHTVFGQVIEGLEIVDVIANAKTNLNDSPLKEIKINNVILQ